MTRYTSGVMVEREVTKYFKDHGWSVIRGAGSKGEFLGFKTDILISYEMGMGEHAKGMRGEELMRRGLRELGFSFVGSRKAPYSNPTMEFVRVRTKKESRIYIQMCLSLLISICAMQMKTSRR